MTVGDVAHTRAVVHTTDAPRATVARCPARSRSPDRQRYRPPGTPTSSRRPGRRNLENEWLHESASARVCECVSVCV